MNFYMPTKVYIESNCVQNHKKEIVSCGTKAFIVTGKHSSIQNGSLQDILDVLEQGNIEYKIFNEVEENPSVETCRKAAEIAKGFYADFVIGIGGGSSMDAAKAIALLIQNPDKTIDCFYKKEDLKACPVIAVPTTCGTGSEVTGKAVLSRPSMHAKGSISHDIFPVLALIDGKYLQSMSSNLLVNTSIDALAHLIESRLNSKSNHLNQMISEYGLMQWKVCKEMLLNTKEIDYEQFMLTSTIAGMAIAQTGTSLPHAMSYDLTCYYNIPHGKACGYYLASYMRVLQQKGCKDVDQILNILGFDSVDTFGEFISSFIGKCMISKEDKIYFCDKIANNPQKLKTAPIELDRSDIQQMIDESIK